MRKTVETMSMSKETELFNNAMDLFFGMNPTKRHWILVAMYLAKNKKLAAVDNYEGDGLVLAEMDIDYVRVKSQELTGIWEQQGVGKRSVVAFVEEDERKEIEKILNEIDPHRDDDGSREDLDLFQMDDSVLLEVAGILNSLSDEWYSQNTKWAFDSIMQNMIAWNHLLGEHYQPKELTELALVLLDAQEGTVYNPYSGMCSYGAMVNSNCQYIAQDINHRCNILGNLNLLINGKHNFVIKEGDSVAAWCGDDCDYIIATPPFRTRCESSYKYSDIDFLARSSEYAKRKAIGIYTSSVYFSGRIAKNSPIISLIDNDWLECVISLPQGIFSETTIPTVMIVVNKNKEKKGVVRFVDASDCFVKSRRNNILTTSEVIDLVKEQKIGKSVDVNNSTVKENNYIIFPGYYLCDNEIVIPDGYELHTLKEYLTNEIQTDRYDGQEIRVFSSSRSSDQIDKGMVYAKNLDRKKLDLNLYKIVNKDCLVLRRSLRDLDFFYLKSDGENVALHKTCHTLAVKSDLLDPQYLLIELGKDYLISQIERFGNNSAGFSSAMNVDDFLNLKILVPSLPMQKSIVEASIFSAKMAQIENLHLQDVIKKMKMDYMDEVRSRKHDMKSHICQLTSAIKNIEYDLVHKNDKNIFSSEKEWLDDMMEEVKNQSFAIKHLNTILDIFSREDKFGNPEVINIGKFISENIVAGKKYKVVHNTDYDALRDYGFDVPEKESNHEFFKGLIKIKIKYELEDEEIEDANVFVAKDDLLRLFDNIINNAVTHGFTEDSKDYCIKTNLSVDPQRNMFQIDITNNGTPLPKGLDKHRYGIKGETAGKTGKSGEGGYIVKSIVEHYKGDFDIFTEDKGKHTLTTVRIFLPIYRTYGK